MTPDEIIKLGKKAEDLKKLQALLQYRNGPYPVTNMTITVKKGSLSKSVSVADAKVIKQIFDTIDDIIFDIDNELKQIGE